MFFASDNSSGTAPAILDALIRANTGYASGYGTDEIMERVTARIREIFEAPEAKTYLVTTGTAANALALACLTPPWGAVFCHDLAHIAEDECGAPEFFTNGAKLALVEGAHGKIDPDALRAKLEAVGGNGVHGVQRAALSLTNVTEAGTLYSPAEIAELTAIAKGYGLGCHLDGARFANAIAASGTSPAEMTWKAGIDILSFGGTKNGCMGVEAVVIFDPARAFEFELRRKRAGHLLSKGRYLSAQFDAYLEGGLWLDLARHANRMAAELAAGLATKQGIRQSHAVEANMMFPIWAKGTNAHLLAEGARFYGQELPSGEESARLVTSWSTTSEDIEAFLSLLP